MASIFNHYEHHEYTRLRAEKDDQYNRLIDWLKEIKTLEAKANEMNGQ